MTEKIPVQQQGISLVEVLIALVIVTIVGLFTAVSVVGYIDARTVMLQDTQKMYLAEAGYEAVRFIRDEDWNTIADLSFETYHYVNIATSTISVSTTPEEIEGRFQRMFQVFPLYRGSDGSVVDATASGAVEDPGGRVVEVHVVDEHGTTTVQTIITNIFAL